MNTLLSVWLYGSALILVAYWYVTISHLLRARIAIADLAKSVGISLLILVLWPYFFIRWLWCLLKGDLTRKVILDPLDNTSNSQDGDQK
jgi:hypothetical protein